MANSISLRKTVTDIRVSNQIMQTLLEMLVSSGTAYASTDTEKNLIVFLAHLDQTRHGTGMSSFYLNELPWKLGSLFQDQVDFMIAVVDDAIARTHWDWLEDFTPEREVYAPHLEGLGRMLAQLDPADVEPSRFYQKWGPPETYLICERHQMLKYQVGSDYYCIYCNRSRETI
jgi:hypothetical protein